MLPNFVIIGAQKAATTSLWRHLGEHPDVFVSPIKETNFFVKEMNWSRGLDWYESLFAAGESRSGLAVGEASPNYTLHPGLPGVPGRMASVIPDAKLIYLLRHPVERMISGYLQALAQGAETLPIERALLERPHYADISRYSMQLDEYLRFFERERVLVLLSEDLEAAPVATLSRALEFIGVESEWRPPSLNVRHHPSAGKRVPRSWWRRLGGMVIRGQVPTFPAPLWLRRSPLASRPLRAADSAISEEVRKQLEELLRPDVASLRKHLGPSFDGWGLLK